MAQPGRPSSGDLTGRQKSQMNKEARVEQQARAAEVSMQDAHASDVELNSVFDAQTGQPLSGPSLAHSVEVVDEPEVRQPAFMAQETVLTGQEDPETVAPVLAAKKAFTAPPPEVVRSSRVRIRVDQDVEGMTYGMVNGEPNNYDFKEGLAYEVPLPVAEHLNDRGLVRQWIAG